MRISIIQFDNALQSAVYGVQELLQIATTSAQASGAEFDARVEIIPAPEAVSMKPREIGDVMFLPSRGVSPDTLHEMVDAEREFVDWLRRFRRSECAIYACCTSVPLLAATNMLNGRKATSTWWVLPYLTQAFPNVFVQPQAMLVEDDRFVTSAGPFSFVSQVIHLVEKIGSPELAVLCAKLAVVEPGRPANGIFVVPNLYKEHDPWMLQIKEYVQQHISAGVSVSSLAAHLNLSERTLHRRLKERIGITARELIAVTRIELAKTMLESTSDSITQIATNVGFQDHSSFRSAFSKKVGATPAAYRERMRVAQ